MWVKLILLLLFCLMILGAVRFAQRSHSEQPSPSANVLHPLRLLTVAEVILRQDPDAVALQELTGKAQLNILLGLLRGTYRGAVVEQGKGDRFEAVLVKDAGATFIPVPVGARYAFTWT
jgi:hypothetical protein